MKSFSMSVKDFKEIIKSITFVDNLDDLMLCIKCEEADIYFKFILEETNITTYYVNEFVTIDTEDIILMFEYKLINDIIEKTECGTIKFELNINEICMTITNSIEIEKHFYNKVDERLLGKLEVEEQSIQLDSIVLEKMLKYFIKSPQKLSKYLTINYLTVSVSSGKLLFEQDNLKISKNINQNIEINNLKLKIDYLYNFITNKKYNLNIYITEHFPIICKAETDLGTIELYSAPIDD